MVEALSSSADRNQTCDGSTTIDVTVSRLESPGFAFGRVFGHFGLSLRGTVSWRRQNWHTLGRIERRRACREDPGTADTLSW